MSFTAFAASTAQKPLAVVVLPTTAWASTYEKRPTDEVAIGLRLLAQKEFDVARAAAARHAVTMLAADDGTCLDERARDEAYNDALMKWAIACACTDPNDAAIPYFELHEIVDVSLTPQGVRRLWDALEILHAEQSPTTPEATDADLLELAARLREPAAIALLGNIEGRYTRRLLGAALERLRAVTPHAPVAAPAGEDDEVTYTAVAAA